MLVPVLHRIIIKMDSIEETDEVLRRAKQMGLQLPEKEIKREQAAAVTGTIVSIGDTCFKDYGGSPDLVKVGDKVYVAKYAGKVVIDSDGAEYTCVNDEDIVALLKD